MDQAHFEQWARDLAAKNDFLVDDVIHIGTYYKKDHVRSMMFSGTYAYEQATMKVYDDPRGSGEPKAVSLHAAHNSSEQIQGPTILSSDMIDTHKGWFITRTSDVLQHLFTSPLSPEVRRHFLKLFLEYRTHLSIEPLRQLHLREYLPAHEFHAMRLGNWFRLAMEAERERETPLLDPSELIPRYTRVMDIIRKTFATRRMIWSHGHFKPDSLLFSPDSGTYTLIDFAHSGMYPEGYELTFMLWADTLMDGDYTQEYSQWRAQVDGWLEDLQPIAEHLGIEDYDELIHASLLERIMGTILADITASDKPRDELVTRLNFIHRLYDQIV